MLGAIAVFGAPCTALFALWLRWGELVGLDKSLIEAPDVVARLLGEVFHVGRVLLPRSAPGQHSLTFVDRDSLTAEAREAASPGP